MRPGALRFAIWPAARASFGTLRAAILATLAILTTLGMVVAAIRPTLSKAPNHPPCCIRRRRCRLRTDVTRRLVMSVNVCGVRPLSNERDVYTDDSQQQTKNM